MARKYNWSRIEAIEARECEAGMTEDEVRAVVPDFPKFIQWMVGQTAAICNGRVYDHETKEYQESGCGPHGIAYYEWDVKNFLEGGPVLD